MNDYIVVRLVEDPKTESGIILPESSDPMYAKGEIVSAGPGRPNEAGDRFEPLPGPASEWIGSKVLFAFFAAVKIEHEGETVYFIRETDILAKIKD